MSADHERQKSRRVLEDMLNGAVKPSGKTWKAASWTLLPNGAIGEAVTATQAREQQNQLAPGKHDLCDYGPDCDCRWCYRPETPKGDDLMRALAHASKGLEASIAKRNLAEADLARITAERDRLIGEKAAMAALAEWRFRQYVDANERAIEAEARIAGLERDNDGVALMATTLEDAILHSQGREISRAMGNYGNAMSKQGLSLFDRYY